MSSYSYKADDSLNYWRSIDVINGIKEIKTQDDSTLEMVERNSDNNDLIGFAKYKVKLSKSDVYAIQKIKNKERLYDTNEITLPVFNKEVDFVQYIMLAGRPIRGYKPEIKEGEEFVEGNVIIRIDFI